MCERSVRGRLKRRPQLFLDCQNLSLFLLHDLSKLGLEPLQLGIGQLALARGDGSYLDTMKSLVKVQLLILDDWGLNQLTKPEALDLLEVIEDRNQRSSTLVISQVPVEAWYQHIEESTIADAILDRLVHNAYR